MAGKLLAIYLVCIGAVSCRRYSTLDNGQIVYQMTTIEYDWPNSSFPSFRNESDQFIPINNIISGMKVYRDEVYVTVPRWRNGVPSTLNKIITKNGKPVLQAFPSWDMQQIGNCNALQYVQSMEVDPNNGWMWIIDSGRINFFAADGTKTQNLCPAKIVIYDINTMHEIQRYEFPSHVANPEVTFLNDIVIEYSRNQPRYAYITDALGFRLIVYDFLLNTSHFFSHPQSMRPEPGNGNITILGETLEVAAGINGIAMSSDFQFIYYGPVAGYSLYQIPTFVARDPKGLFEYYIRKVGQKPSQSAGMAYSQNNNLYFPALGENAIYRWNIKTDKIHQRSTYSEVLMTEIEKVLSDDERMRFVDILTFDLNGNLWFSVNKLHKFFIQTLDLTGADGPNVYIWKVPVGETGYLDQRKRHNVDYILNQVFTMIKNLLGPFFKFL